MGLWYNMLEYFSTHEAWPYGFESNYIILTTYTYTNFQLCHLKCDVPLKIIIEFKIIIIIYQKKLIQISNLRLNLCFAHIYIYIQQSLSFKSHLRLQLFLKKSICKLQLRETKKKEKKRGNFVLKATNRLLEWVRYTYQKKKKKEWVRLTLVLKMVGKS